MDFDEWLISQKPEPEPEPKPEIHEELEGQDDINGYYYYPCNCCGDDTLIEDPEDFDPDFVYCGRRPSCCP